MKDNSTTVKGEDLRASNKVIHFVRWQPMNRIAKNSCSIVVGRLHNKGELAWTGWNDVKGNENHVAARGNFDHILKIVDFVETTLCHNFCPDVHHQLLMYSAWGTSCTCIYLVQYETQWSGPKDLVKDPECTLYFSRFTCLSPLVRVSWRRAKTTAGFSPQLLCCQWMRWGGHLGASQWPLLHEGPNQTQCCTHQEANLNRRLVYTASQHKNQHRIGLSYNCPHPRAFLILHSMWTQMEE